MRNPVICFLEVDKTCVDVISINRTRTALGIRHLWLAYFTADIFKTLGTHTHTHTHLSVS